MEGAKTMLEAIGTIFGVFIGTGLISLLCLGGLIIALAFMVKGIIKLVKWIFK